MKALFLTPITEEMKIKFKETNVDCFFKDKTTVTKEDFQGIDIIF